MDPDLKNLVESSEFQEYHKEQQDRPFNLFDVLGNADYEIRHSNVLEWLLGSARVPTSTGSKFLREVASNRLNDNAGTDRNQAAPIPVPVQLSRKSNVRCQCENCYWVDIAHFPSRIAKRLVDHY